MAAASRRKVFLYGGLDLVFGLAYLLLGRDVDWTPDRFFWSLSLVMTGAALAAGIGTLAGRRWGWWLAVAGCLALLAAAALLLGLLALSGAFLFGVYGAWGKAAARLTFVLVLAAVELYVLLPSFQLRWLLGDEGRRALGRPRPS